jgi:hypothetical protein
MLFDKFIGVGPGCEPPQSEEKQNEVKSNDNILQDSKEIKEEEKTEIHNEVTSEPTLKSNIVDMA